jgi:GNAT superfamily N-acetyltransferase
MAEITLHQLKTLKQVEVCDQLFRDYMRWLIGELFTEHQIIISAEQEESLHHKFSQEWSSMLRGKGGVYLAKDDGVPVGVCTLKPISEEEVELKRFYVSPAHRGTGVGRLLLEHSLDAAKNYGYRLIRLETFAFMKSAVKMYKAYGFEEVEAFDGFEGSNHGTGNVELFMVKQNY